MRRKGFTLIEVLVVVSIIALMVSMLLPALSAARRAAKSTVCLSQSRQIGTATLMYAQANGDQFPLSSHSAGYDSSYARWGYALFPHLGYARCLTSGSGAMSGPSWDRVFNGMYRCPEDRRRDCWSYGKNNWFELNKDETGEVLGVADGARGGPTFPKLSNVPAPCTTILYGELASDAKDVDHIMVNYWYQGGKPEVDTKRHGPTCNFAFVDGHAESRRFETTFDLTKRIDRWCPAKVRTGLLASN